MLNINKKLSKKGFSLIELMIAITILAIAIFGIFQAYSVGFMGMADARDRTVATNYLQQTIEDFKNMNFNQVQNDPITPIPGTKFSRGTYVLNLEEIDDVVTLKKVISLVRWVDRKGNIKTEKASTIIYNKPATSEVTGAARIIIYAQPYYTILPDYSEGLDLYAEIKDENGNTVSSGDITFSIITEYGVGEAPVGYIYNEGRTVGNPVDTGTESAPDGIAHVKFYPFTFEFVDGIERIQASAIIGGVEKTDTVNIRVTTGPVAILLEPPVDDEDNIISYPAEIGQSVSIDLTIIKADYEEEADSYSGSIDLSVEGPGTLSTNEIILSSDPTASFTVTSNGTPGVVEITASAPDLDMGYTEITFTGEPASILITPEKDSIYPGEDIGITVTIVDVNNEPVDFDGVVNLSADPNDYGIFSPNSLDFENTSDLELISTFTAYSSATPGETVMLQASSGGSLSGSTEITVLSLLTPTYLDIFAFPMSVDLNGSETFTTVKAEVFDESGSKTVTTYNEDITFYSKIDGVNFGIFSPNFVVAPIDGVADDVTLSSSVDNPGTTIITASSGDLILRPAEGIEVVFYKSAHHIELSADPVEIEANGHETSIITATVCDEYGNRVANYGTSGESITFTTTIGKFHFLGNSPDVSDTFTITTNDFNEGIAKVEFYSNITSDIQAEISAVSSDGKSDNGSAFISLTGDIPSEISDPFNIVKLTDYLTSFDIYVSGSPLYLEKITVEWNNPSAVLSEIIVNSPYPDDSFPLVITPNGASSPFIENEFTTKTLVTTYTSNIRLRFSDSAIAKKKITVIFTDEDNIDYPVSFTVPK